MNGRELAGRVAIVTGSSRNIGRAIAVDLAAAGAAVVVNARQSAEEARAVADSIVASGGRSTAVLADVAHEDAVRTLIDESLATFGRLDILVNNAALRREVDFADLTYAEWREVMAITLDSAYLCCRAALTHLKMSPEAAIVNIGGLSAHTGSARRAHVVAAKAGLAGFTRALAHDLSPYGITVNCVAPGLIATHRPAEAGRPEPAHHATHAPLVGRRGTADEIASLVRFLCGPRARYITGQTLHANGGVFMG
ncbi:MAG: SDR family oxidoreductase [Vicinamibacterales bacterium]